MALKKIDPDELKLSAEKYNEAIQMLEDEEQALKAFIEQLKNDWDSEASDIYVNNLNNVIKKLRNSRNALKELSSFSTKVRHAFLTIDKIFRSLIVISINPK